MEMIVVAISVPSGWSLRVGGTGFGCGSSGAGAGRGSGQVGVRAGDDGVPGADPAPRPALDGAGVDAGALEVVGGAQAAVAAGADDVDRLVRRQLAGPCGDLAERDEER